MFRFNSCRIARSAVKNCEFCSLALDFDAEGGIEEGGPDGGRGQVVSFCRRDGESDLGSSAKLLLETACEELTRGGVLE
jgi:hypothetical protein